MAELLISRQRSNSGVSTVCMEISKIPSPDDPSRDKLSVMETITLQVGELPANERSAAELLLGHSLRGNEQLILQVRDLEVVRPPEQESQLTESLPAWCHVYEGLSDHEVEKIQQSITRCNLTRPVE